MSNLMRRTAAPALTLTLALALTACGGGDDNPATPGDDEFLAGSPGQSSAPDDDAAGEDGTGEDGTETSDPMDDTDDTDGGAESGDATAAALLAITVAEEHAGGTAYAIDDADDDATWEVDVAVEDRTVEVEVDAVGAVVGTEDDDLDSDDRSALDAAAIMLADAVEQVMAQSDGTFDDAEIDEDDGRWYWSVTVDEQGDDVDYRVDPQSGDITRDDD
ncbi:hypothetical protein GCM10009718_14450 [Isoptericola halotolerans]|uniref:Membrane protein YkoI n=1 Tax=Isoptericola halotolerans TaxID=300560 RepID=A0ABX1ZYF8_9MICO|nr:PepSY domain-containing protein [Isoptericola halotolerans]NOV95633.1 putative membrane protein YkoI [Isoptericola halotolerans]